MGTRKSKKIKNARRHKTKDGRQKVAIDKSFQDSSRSFVSPDYSNKASWYFQAVEVVDEIATTSDDTTYSFGTGKTVINLKYVTDRTDWQSKKITVKKNDVEITTGFTKNPDLNNVVFDVANQGTDVVKISYAYENGSSFDLIAGAGKKLLLNYVETQFSVDTTFPVDDCLVFEMILNNPNVGDVDYVAGFTEYCTAKDFLNKGNHGSVLRAFGELTKDVNVFPWNYQTGYTLKPVGDASTDPNNGEFNKIRMRMKNNSVYTNCEIATGTFYCLIEDL